MTAIAEQLAHRALLPVSADEAVALRRLTATNLAAGLGDRGAVGRTVDAFPLDADRHPGDAAYLFAARLHARTQDDFFPEGRVHVGAIALAATLALAAEAGDNIIDCLAAGYRVMCDVSAVYSRRAQSAGLRPSGVFGPMGAAASASAALGLTPARTSNAIALAAASCGGHNQAWISSSDEWILEVGAAARAGVEAALFTAAGARASDAAFEGRAGWASAFFGAEGAVELKDHLAGPRLGPEVVAVKPYPVSGIAQVPTALACQAHHDLAGAGVASVRVGMSPIEFAYPGSANAGPFTSRSGALMSIAFCVACGLLDGAVPLRRLERPDAPDLAAMLRAVDVVAEPDLPENVARLDVEADDGRRLTYETEAAQLLYPSWDQVSADMTGLAVRSEADESQVTAAVAELARERPQAKALRDLLHLATAEERS